VGLVLLLLVTVAVAVARTQELSPV
jgi:hypothetical protein